MSGPPAAPAPWPQVTPAVVPWTGHVFRISTDPTARPSIGLTFVDEQDLRKQLCQWQAAIARTARRLRPSLSSDSAERGTLPHVEIRDLAIYSRRTGAAGVSVAMGARRQR